MRSDLKQNCAEVAVQETLKSLELKFENSERQKADLLRQLEHKSKEIEALEGKVDSMNQKFELLVKNIADNYEVLSKRVDAVNETAQGVLVTFDG